MRHKAKFKYFKEILPRNKETSKKEKHFILDEFCSVCSYNQKFAIRLLNGGKKSKPKLNIGKTGRFRSYSNPIILHFLKALLRATSMICSKRFKTTIPLWLPFFVSKHFTLRFQN